MTNKQSDTVQHHTGTHVSTLMLRVVYALIPAITLMVVFFGSGVVVQILLAVLTAYVCEALMLKLRRRALMPFLSDGSALVTAILLGMSVPVIAPWWVIVTGTAFAMIFGKHLYGGLGYNIFNPAMLGYAMLLISFPLEMTTWQAPLSILQQSPSILQSAEIIFLSSPSLTVDAISAATPLDSLKTQFALGNSIATTMTDVAYSRVFGTIAGLGWEWVNLAILLGGIWLIIKGVIRWHIPAALLATMFIMSSIFYLYDSEQYASPLLHLFSGATMLGAFFIATDPVSASTTPRGQLIYAAGIAILTYVIRNWGGYPDAIAFAVLLMNMAAPTIDYYTKPRVFGDRGKS